MPWWLSGNPLGIQLVKVPKPLQQQIRVMHDFATARGNNHAAHATRRNSGHGLAQLIGDAVDQTIDGSRVGIQHARIHAFDGILANEALRLFKLDERQLRALRGKRVLRNHDARINDGADIRAIAREH